jgi:hypothetical protein
MRSVTVDGVIGIVTSVETCHVSPWYGSPLDVNP